MKFPLIIFFALLLSPLQVFAQDETKTEKVAEGIYLIISPKGGNVVLSAGEDGNFLMDDQLEPRSEILKETIGNINDEEIKFILNTHYHFDHTGGNEFFGEDGTIIVAHDNVRKRLNSKQFISYFKREMKPLSKAGLPVVTFDNDVTFHFNNQTIEMTHMPNAHTDGDVIAYFKQANVLVAGDTIFNGFYPFIDIEHGGSIRGVIKAADAMLDIANDETKIIPGHGPVLTRDELKDYKAALKSMMDSVAAAIKAGKSKEEVIAAKPAASFDSQFKKGPVDADTFISIMYDDLSR